MAKKVKLYHATDADNLGRILMEGLIAKWEGVYLTDSAESAARWIGFRLRITGEEEMAVVEVDVDETKLEEGTDHSPLMVMMFGVGRSLLSVKPIPKSRVKKVHYFKI